MSWSYRPSLDGLRTLAMYLIVLFHANVAWAEGTFIAVNLFFVLSGYLVTNVILTDMDRTGTLRLGVFYARRVRRLLPAALVAIVGISVLFLLVLPVVRRVSLVGDAQSALLYVANWRFIQQGNDYFATDVDKSPFLHFWTLGIEEQFYVLFPLVILLLSRSARRWALFAGLSAIFLLSLGAQLYWARVDELHAYFGTDARLYQLVAGALLAVGFRMWPPRVGARTASAAGIGGMTAFLVLSFAFDGLSESTRGILGTLACTLLIAGLMLGERQALGRVLSRPVPVYLGKISYSTYLWHWPAILVLQQILEIRALTLAVMAAVLATAMAAASNELLEMPIRTTRLLDGFRWRVVVAGVTASVVTAVAVVPGILESERKPRLVAATETAASPAPVATPEADEVEKVELPKDVDWKKVERDRGTEHRCTRKDPEGCVVVEGSGPHVLVIGDSHARMMSDLFEKLAREKSLTLSMNTAMGCPWQENLENTVSSPERRERCADSRVGWYDDVLPRLEPDVVVLIGLPRDAGRWETKLRQRDGGDRPLQQAVLTATDQTLRKINRVADRTLLVESLLLPEKDPNECLTTVSDPEECTIPMRPRNRPTDGFYLTAAAQDPDVFTVDLNPAFCPTMPVCQPVVDGEIVWREHLHLTPSFAAKQRHEVWRLIRRSGVLDDSRPS